MKYLMISSIVLLTIGCSPKLAPDADWGRQRWVLIDLKGVPVQLSGSNRDAFIEFSPSERRFTGNGGCNRLSGNYSLEKKGSVRFGEVISTKMSCTDIAFETTFLQTLNEVDRYTVEDNSLFLKDGNKVLLVFKGK
jgi:heat shock protein HslJ